MDKKKKTACQSCEARAELARAVDEDLSRELLPPLSEPQTEPETERVSVVDVRFRSGGKVYYFDPDGYSPKQGDAVILDTARGAEFGICAGGVHQVDAVDVVAPLRKVLRIATEQDMAVAAANREKEKRAFAICQQKIADHHLEMQLVSAECAFDGSKLLFFFTADGRVDFRDLVKNLAATFHTRIELRQIGVRDKAKMVGGLGVCGRPFCCSEFMDEFQPVSIKMAKTQNLSLNPGKISGTCGRLMCCLKYEQEAYEDLLKHAPKVESFVDTPGGRGTICDVNLLRQTVRVRMEDHPESIESYRSDEIAVLRSGKARKGDPPIPKDLAPISGHQAPRRRLAGVEDIRETRGAEESISSIFRKLDEYAAPAAETPEPEHRGSRRRRRKGTKPDAAAESPRPHQPAEHESRPHQPAEHESRPHHPYRRRNRRPRRPGGEKSES